MKRSVPRTFAAFVRNPTIETYEAFFGFVRPPHPDRFVEQIFDFLRAGAAPAAATGVFCGLGTPEAFERELADPMLGLITQVMVPVPPGYEHPAGTRTTNSTDLPSFMAEILSNRTK